MRLLLVSVSPVRSRFLPLFLLSLCLIFQTSSQVQAAPAVVTVVDFTSWSFRGDIANFANPLDEDFAYASNLMLPPDNPELCEFPPSLLVGNNNTITVEMRTPVALLISLGGTCRPIDKVNIALRIQREVTRAVRYLVFYNNNPDDPDDIPNLMESDFYGLEDKYQSIAVVAVSTTVGGAMMGRVEQLRGVTGANPQFLGNGNSRWQLPMVLELITDRYPSRGGYTAPAPESFYWFRFVLFTLLIISPCCRAGYLWWAGGGRIRFRRNENGRIVGLQYIPPMTYWFASNGPQGGEGGPQITDRLTEEEVMALPEIMYRMPKEEQHTNTESAGDDIVRKDSDAGQTTEISQGSLDNEGSLSELGGGEVDIVVSPGSDDVPVVGASSLSSSSGVSSGVVSAAMGSIDEPVAEEDPTKTYSTMCTTCSICIDEFEEGEMVRLLPRCNHAFHTECIIPWLTERQGCCPLCKVSVVEQPDEQQQQQEGDAGNDNGEGAVGVATNVDDTVETGNNTDAGGPEVVPPPSSLSLSSPGCEDSSSAAVAGDHESLASSQPAVQQPPRSLTSGVEEVSSSVKVQESVQVEDAEKGGDDSNSADVEKESEIQLPVSSLSTTTKDPASSLSTQDTTTTNTDVVSTDDNDDENLGTDEKDNDGDLPEIRIAASSCSTEDTSNDAPPADSNEGHAVLQDETTF